MKHLAYILHIDGRATGQGAVMTPAEAEHTNTMAPPGYEWKNPQPRRDTCFDVIRLDGTRKSYAGHNAYEADMQAGGMDDYRRRSVEYRKTQDTGDLDRRIAEKAA